MVSRPACCGLPSWVPVWQVAGAHRMAFARSPLAMSAVQFIIPHVSRPNHAYSRCHRAGTFPSPYSQNNGLFQVFSRILTLDDFDPSWTCSRIYTPDVTCRTVELFCGKWLWSGLITVAVDGRKYEGRSGGSVRLCALCLPLVSNTDHSIDATCIALHYT